MFGSLPSMRRLCVPSFHLRPVVVLLAVTFVVSFFLATLGFTQDEDVAPTGAETSRVFKYLKLPVVNGGYQTTPGVVNHGHHRSSHHAHRPSHKNAGENEVDWVDKNADYRILTSIRNARGLYNKIDLGKTGLEFLNPTILELPRGQTRHEFIVIARAYQVDEEIDGMRYHHSRQFATFANLSFGDFDRPFLETTSDWSTFLVNDFKGPLHHCQNEPITDFYYGPEDMKLYWSRLGEPLLIFVHQINHKHRCQAQHIVDLRAEMPELEDELDANLKMPPIRFNKPVELYRRAPPGEEDAACYQREKNWAPFQSPFANSSELMFMVEPSLLFRYYSEGEAVELVDADRYSAVKAPYPVYKSANETWRSEKKTCLHDVMLSDHGVHLSSPMLSLTLCNRGDCEPTPENTVMIGLVHHHQDPLWYDRRIAAYSPVPPFNLLSVSKKLSYHGEEEGRWTWTGSMTYFHHHRPDRFPSKSHGFLDDEIWLSFGIQDQWGGWIDVEARELVTDHYLCEKPEPEQ